MNALIFFRYGLFCVDCTADNSAGCSSYNSPPLVGAVSLSCQFSKGLPSSCELIVICEYSRILTVNEELKPSFTTAATAAGYADEG